MKKSFRVCFSPLVVILLILTLLVGLSGVAINIYSLVVLTPFDYAFKYILFGVLCLILAVFILAVLLFSGYKIQKEKLTLSLGFIKSTFSIKNAVNLTCFEDKKMLVLFFDNGEYTRILVKKEDFIPFSESVKEENPFVILNSTNYDK